MPKVAQDRFYGPDATPHDLGDNPIRSEFNYTLENGQRTKLEETFYFDHDGDGGQTTPALAKSTTYDWVYDANDRLLSETIDHRDDALDRTESFVMDLFGNRTKRTIDYVDPTAVDQAFAYSYDDNDRLTIETLDENADGSIDKTTQYSWDSTQQAAKETFTGDSTAAADLVSSQTFAYDLQGRLAEVINTPETGPATKVTYTYDSSGIRVSSSQFTDANSNGVFETSELDHTIDYLVDHRNHTGYAQTIAETTTDSNGDNLKRVTTTFGTDELSQTTYMPDPATADAWLAEAMHIFGHDAHGSVRVLLDALGEIAQTFTYGAYGELLAIYDATGTLVGTLGAADTSAALTRMLYSGESFDSRIGQQYLRARWYNATAGRFSRLDPYFGTLNDPLSFNKYNYVHSNPVYGVDPTGKFLSTALSFSVRAGLVSGGVTGGLTLLHGLSKGFTNGFNGDYSVSNTLWRSAAAFGIGFGAGFGAAFSWSYMVLAAGVPTSVASFAVGFSLGPAGLEMLRRNTVEAFQKGDKIDQVFAVADIVLVVFASRKIGIFRTGSTKNRDVAFKDSRGVGSEFDEVVPRTLFIEDKGDITISRLQIGASHSGQSISDAAETWATKNILNKTNRKIRLLPNATSTHPQEGGSRAVLPVEDFRGIRNFHFRVNSQHPTIVQATKNAVRQLKADNPGWNFNATFGNAESWTP